jgi:hypothetical protein
VGLLSKRTMSILLFGEVRARGVEQRVGLPEDITATSIADTEQEREQEQHAIWTGQWYFAKNQMNSKEFLYRRISDSVPKNVIEYVSFTSSSSQPKPRGRKKMKYREGVDSAALPPPPLRSVHECLRPSPHLSREGSDSLPPAQAETPKHSNGLHLSLSLPLHHLRQSSTRVKR